MRASHLAAIDNLRNSPFTKFFFFSLCLESPTSNLPRFSSILQFIAKTVDTGSDIILWDDGNGVHSRVWWRLLRASLVFCKPPVSFKLSANNLVHSSTSLKRDEKTIMGSLSNSGLFQKNWIKETELRWGNSTFLLLYSYHTVRSLTRSFNTIPVVNKTFIAADVEALPHMSGSCIFIESG